MATPSLEQVMDLTTKVNKIGFVDFTTDLVSNVYNVIVKASMDQLRTYSEYVKDVSKPLSEFQTSLGLGLDNNGAHTTELKANVEKYATEVLGLIGIDSASNPTATSGLAIASYKLEGSDFSAVNDKRAAIIADLAGIDYDTSNTTAETIDQVMPTALTTGTSLSISAASKSNLDKIIAIKLRAGAEENYNLLATILKIGMQKIVVDKGLIATKLTFHVDASQDESTAKSNLNSKSRGFNVGGSIRGGGKKLGGSVSAGYNSSKLSVSVVNERSSAVANLAVDIVGEVKIEFRTDSFPSVN
jgi:hypothetical protein